MSSACAAGTAPDRDHVPSAAADVVLGIMVRTAALTAPPAQGGRTAARNVVAPGRCHVEG